MLTVPEECQLPTQYELISSFWKANILNRWNEYKFIYGMVKVKASPLIFFLWASSKESVMLFKT